MTDQQTSGGPWPPAIGLPLWDRMKLAESLRWSETPFDDLTRAEIFRLVQDHHLALISADGTLRRSAFRIRRARSGR
ncbi:hypothetical protein EBE87_24650 [Pseudoroseomonas wenyumeiae]|uniref:Uncharacterized protein n=1 Tax=Teichococcus wenyumeiae TaxID=2478470 RepID=A0A3A9JW53_9PROT|nr:hypothetical protein D6Z83_15445 [Pseudoroseomonas wenyumeiae]RMI16958.1 hypothetical protein EBE87_24650 [Pseudoroseomonas wenyumeiae]